MSIKIYDNQKIGIADALKGYLTTSEGLQDYAMGAGCVGDVLYTIDNNSQVARNLSMAGAGVNYISKLPNTVISVMNTPEAIEYAIKEPTVANVGRAFYSATGAGGSSLGFFRSSLNALWGRVSDALSLSSSAVEITLDITSLMDQCKIESVYSKKNMHPNVTEALADTRVWRGLCLGRSLAKTCAKVALVVAPVLALPVAIASVAFSTAVSIGMSIAETIYRKCFMKHAPVHPNHLENQGKDLALIRNETCVIL